MKLTGTMHTTDESRGKIRVEELYDTDIDDLWQACTTPERLARWIATVTGDLRVGGTIHATYTSSATGPARIDACESPNHLLLTSDPGTEDEAQLEAWLTSEGAKTRLVVEERGLPADKLHFYGAGWQTHLEDLARTLASGEAAHPDGWSDQQPSPAWEARWKELTPAYEQQPVS